MTVHYIELTLIYKNHNLYHLCFSSPRIKAVIFHLAIGNGGIQTSYMVFQNVVHGGGDFNSFSLLSYNYLCQECCHKMSIFLLILSCHHYYTQTTISLEDLVSTLFHVTHFHYGKS